MKNTTLKAWVVDDEPEMCQGVLRTLEDLTMPFEDLNESVSFRGAAMDSGEEFLDRIRHVEAPDLLLLDGKLPGLDGIEVLKELGARKQPVVTVMITAYATLENAVKATKLGAFDFLAKPFTPSELRHAIARASREIILVRRARQLEHDKKRIRFEFLSVLAHELKSPLAALEGFVEMLRVRQSPEALDRMEARIGGMRKLISDLLDLTALESGKRRRQTRIEDICEIAREVLEMQAAFIDDKKLSAAVVSESPCTLECDRGEMEMLIGNLLTNAIKYNREGGRIEINISSRPDAVVIAVSDTGIGIADKDREKLFREFSRIKSDHTRSVEGSGLGLSIVKKIADLYKANLTVKSREGQGSTFEASIPNTRSNTPKSI